MIFNLVIMTIKPTGDRVLIKPIRKVEEITKLGIILPDTAEKEKPERGEVIALGEGIRLEDGRVIPFSLKVGDKVLFKMFVPDEFKENGEEYLIIREANVLAVLVD